METEIWRAISGPYRPGYEVSNLGRVRGSLRGRTAGLCSTRQGFLGKSKSQVSGYCKVSLALQGTNRRILVSVHRLVAVAFVPGDSALEVNHKDLDKANNRAGNLEWVTHAENHRHGVDRHPTWRGKLLAAARSRSRPVAATDSAGAVEHFPSARAAALALGDARRAANIKHAIDCGGLSYGRRWAYA